MHSFLSLLQGIFTGFIVAMPVGPIAVLCMRRTLEQRFTVGLLTGIGAASADFVYAAIAAFGVTALSSFLLKYNNIIQLIGGLVLAILAFHIFQTRKKHLRSSSRTMIDKNSLLKKNLYAYGSGFLLTLMNPMTMIAFMAIFAGFGWNKILVQPETVLFFVTGIFSGSFIWWLFLCGLVAQLHHLISNRLQYYFNIITAFFIAGFSIYAILSSLPNLIKM